MGQEIKIKVTDKLKEVVQANVQPGKHTDIPPNIQAVLHTKTKNAKDKTVPRDVFVSIEDIKWLHTNVVEGLADVYLHELISDEDIVLPEPEVLPRNPELEARIQRLKVQQMEREYKNMTKNVDSVRVNHPEDTIINQINRQLIAVVQFIVSVGAGFTFGFIGVELIVGDLDFGFRLLLGVICALIIALAEIYFLAKKLADDLVPPTPPPGTEGGVSGAKGKAHQD
ncbi:hypothetical protein M8J76_003550 [Diaphorina citri]|nr:hypothetical protein M8J75_008383 [Diaphorina citri]KAI5748951.1 hypothetical protein M8J76_003550 [Diaphorina citri]